MDKDKANSVKALWDRMDAKKGQRVTRSEEYAQWTIPHVFPSDTVADAEQTNALNGFGAEAVNFLSNKIVSTLFNPRAPYFRLAIGKPLEDAITEDDQEEVSKSEIAFALSQAELQAVKKQEGTKALRAQSTLTAKLLIITGNALLYYNKKNSPIKVFSLRNYCIRRDGNGKAILMITREVMMWSSIPDDIKESMPTQLTRGKSADTEVTLYTKVMQNEATKKWSVQQALDTFDLPESGRYDTDTLPWVPLTWHLNQGEHYGRGLVEDYAGDFHALDVMSEALIKGLAILSDIKFFVRPGAQVDPQELNDSPTGSYHYGKEGDITTPNFNRSTDFQILQGAIQQYERRLGRAFLMGVAVTRDAERVTAEEIRRDATELETAHSGLYSRMVDEWQRPFATLGLQDIEFALFDSFEVNIVAGLETMSRAKDMDNFQWFLQDLKSINDVPEELRGVFDKHDLIAFVGSNRGVDYTQFMKSREQEADDRAKMEQKALENEARLKGMDVAGELATKPTGDTNGG